ncbi:MAG TPA: hypothetical protein VFB54_18030 [Burkholderiales bacterium]|nr:hypothetical protein [Burkholderiales bacterium]
MGALGDDDLAFASALAAAGLHDLDPADLAFLRRAHERLQRPLPLPTGFVVTTQPACLPALFSEDR